MGVKNKHFLSPILRLTV